MKKKLVKFLAMGLALTMGLAACGGNEAGNGEAGNGGVITAPWQVLTTSPYGCPNRRVSQS